VAERLEALNRVVAMFESWRRDEGLTGRKSMESIHSHVRTYGVTDPSHERPNSFVRTLDQCPECRCEVGITDGHMTVRSGQMFSVMLTSDVST